LGAAPTALLAHIDDLSGDQVDASWPHSWTRKAWSWSVRPDNRTAIAAGLSLAEKRRLLAQLLQEKSEQSAAVFRSRTASAVCGSSTRWSPKFGV